MDYQKAYCLFFHAITQATDKIDSSRLISQEMEDGLKILKQAQQDTEELYLEHN